MTRLPVKIKRLSPLLGSVCPEPSYATSGSAGMDLAACIKHEMTLAPGQRARIPCGFAIQLPSAEWVALIFARSGLASKFGIQMANGVGVIDSDYTGEIQCVLYNAGNQVVTIQPGDRVAQMVFTPCSQAQLLWTDELETTDRGANGFGSTGI